MAARVTRAAPLALVLLLVAAPARARDFSAVDEGAGGARRRLRPPSAGPAASPSNGVGAAGFPRAAGAIARLPLDYAPGSSFQYSDTGFILLGELVRRVSGERLDAYLARGIFRPLP